MMRLGTPLLAVALFWLSVHADEGGTLIVKVTNLRSDGGQVVACLYRNEDGFPKDERKAWRRRSAPIARGVAELRFVGVPPGTYAVLAFHDENGDGALERSFLGIPREGVALSNNARGHLGPPKFKDARFEMKATDQTLVIQTVYL
jgi:uncharacterized protein (DUF2141 family)